MVPFSIERSNPPHLLSAHWKFCLGKACWILAKHHLSSKQVIIWGLLQYFWDTLISLTSSFPILNCIIWQFWVLLPSSTDKMMMKMGTLLRYCKLLRETEARQNPVMLPLLTIFKNFVLVSKASIFFYKK